MRRKLIALVLIPLLLGLAARAYRWGMADIHAAPALHHIKVWQKRGDLPDTAGDWDKYRNKLAEALKYHPGFPPYLEALGEIDLMRSLDIFLGDAEAAEVRQTALKAFREVVRRRPSWPYGWGKIVSLKWANHESGEELFHGLERAASLGPWESKVQEVVTVAGLSNWERLEPARKRIISGIFRLSAQRQPDWLMNVTDYYEARDIVCPALDAQQKSRYCPEFRE